MFMNMHRETCVGCPICLKDFSSFFVLKSLTNVVYTIDNHCYLVAYKVQTNLVLLLKALTVLLEDIYISYKYSSMLKIDF